MDTTFVRAVFDIDCDWEDPPPVYRVYVNEELFTERVWDFPPGTYLEQHLQIQSPPGRLIVSVESAGPGLAKFQTSNHRILFGPARWHGTQRIEIHV